MDDPPSTLERIAEALESCAQSLESIASDLECIRLDLENSSPDDPVDVDPEG